MRLAGNPSTNSSSEFLERVGNVVPDLVPACGSKEEPKCDADANSQEQRRCGADP